MDDSILSQTKSAAVSGCLSGWTAVALCSAWFQYYVNFCRKTISLCENLVNNDALAEWLRRVPAKYMGFPRESSNLSGVANFCKFIFSFFHFIPCIISLFTFFYFSPWLISPYSKIDFMGANFQILLIFVRG